MGDVAVKNLPKQTVWLSLLIILSLSVFILQEKSWGLIILFVLAYLLRRLMIKRLQGTTGDTAGAMIEVMEVSTLLVLILANTV